jgi:peroxiredoxin
VADFQHTRRRKQQAKTYTNDQRSDMSTRAQRRRQEKVQSSSPRKNPGGTIAAIVAAVAMVAIIAYAIVQRNAQVRGVAVAPQAQASMPPPVKVGTHAPGFTVQAKGGTISSASFAGKPYLIEIFATWCPHCQRMTTVLRDIRRKFPPSRLGMVSVTGSPYAAGSTVDQVLPEDQADVDTFDAMYGVSWPSAFDKDMTVAKTWGLAGFPGIFIVDAHGKIRSEYSGEVDEKTLVAAIKKAGA